MTSNAYIIITLAHAERKFVVGEVHSSDATMVRMRRPIAIEFKQDLDGNPTYSMYDYMPMTTSDRLVGIVNSAIVALGSPSQELIDTYVAHTRRMDEIDAENGMSYLERGFYESFSNLQRGGAPSDAPQEPLDLETATDDDFPSDAKH